MRIDLLVNPAEAALQRRSALGKDATVQLRVLCSEKVVLVGSSWNIDRQ